MHAKVPGLCGIVHRQMLVPLVVAIWTIVAELSICPMGCLQLVRRTKLYPIGD